MKYIRLFEQFDFDKDFDWSEEDFDFEEEHPQNIIDILKELNEPRKNPKILKIHPDKLQYLIKDLQSLNIKWRNGDTINKFNYKMKNNYYYLILSYYHNYYFKGKEIQLRNATNREINLLKHIDY